MCSNRNCSYLDLHHMVSQWCTSMCFFFLTFGELCPPPSLTDSYDSVFDCRSNQHARHEPRLLPHGRLCVSKRLIACSVLSLSRDSSDKRARRFFLLQAACTGTFVLSHAVFVPDASTKNDSDIFPFMHRCKNNSDVFVSLHPPVSCFLGLLYLRFSSLFRL